MAIKRIIQRTLGWSLLAVLLIVLLLLTIFAALVYTETGSRWALQTARGYLPPELTLGMTQGTLASPLTLQDVRFENAGVTVTVDRLDVEWQLFDLLDGQVVINHLGLDGVAVDLRATAESETHPASTEPWALPQLPVDIDLQSFAMTYATLTPEPDADPIVIDSLRAGAIWNSERIALSGLQLQAPLLTTTGQAELSFDDTLAAPLSQGRGAAELAAAGLSVQLQYAARPPQLAALAGELKLVGTLADLNVTLQARQPYGLALEGTLVNLLQRPAVDVAVSANTAALAELSEAWPALRLVATAELAGNASELVLTGRGATVAAAGAEAPGNVRGDVELVYSPDRVRITSVTLEELSHAGAAVPPIALSAAGIVELGGSDAQLDVAAQWQHLRWPLEGPPQVESPRGALTLLGTLARYRAVLEATLAVPNQPGGQIELTGSGTQTDFALERLDAQVLEGTVTGSGRIDWRDGLQADADLTLAGINPAGLSADWPGRVDGSARLLVRQANASAPMAIELQETQLSGTLRDAPLTGAIALRYQQPALQISAANISLGDNTLKLAGAISANRVYDLTFAVNAAALGTVLPGAQGSGTATGTLRGPEDSVILQASAVAQGLRYRDHLLERARLELDVGLAPSHGNVVTAQLETYRNPDLAVQSATFSLQGPQTSHRIELAAQADAGALDLALTGAVSDPLQRLGPDSRYQFAFERLHVAPMQQAPWHLQEPASGSLSQRDAALERLCLVSAPSTACLAGAWQGGSDAAVQIDLQELTLARFNSLLPPELNVTGTLNGGGSLALRAQQLTAELGFDSSVIELVSTDVGTETTTEPAVRFAPGRLSLTAAPAAPVQLLFKLPLEQAGGIEADVQVNPDPADLGSSALSGTLVAELEDLAPLAELLPEVSRLGGQLRSELSIAGTLAEPLAGGQIAVVDGLATLVEPGITVADIDLELSAEPQTTSSASVGIPLRLRGSMRSGEGPLRVVGALQYANASLDGEVAVTGERFRILDNELAQVYVSPDLNIAIADDRLKLRGVLSVPEADIAVKSLPDSAVVVSDDQVIVGTDEDETTASPYRYDARLTLKLGEQVRFEGFGLKARFTGDLGIRQATGEPGLGRGEINIVDGRYQAYGQDLSIETGRAIWTNSPLDQPGIDLRAVRKPRPDIVVGVRARGLLSQPDFSLFSEPSLSESDTLSYLVLGRPLEDNSSAESSLVAQAALALGIRGGNFLSEQFGDRLGVDQIGIETEAGAGNSSAAFVVGKYLSPKLYVSYGLGLLDSVSTLKLEYLLSSHWRLVTESSTVDSGGDLIYTIERE